ncbi:MAG: hypothetical protein K2X32_15365 [Phycisphaerales bacterium]|nr:hypothetical protein [Phycisphaerales bacterium]
MHSLISEKSRQKMSEPAKAAAAPPGLSPQRKRLLVLCGLLGIVGVGSLVWALWGTEEPVPTAAAAKASEIATQIRELEEADKRIRPPTVETPPPSPNAAKADPTLAPKNLRSRTPQ